MRAGRRSCGHNLSSPGAVQVSSRSPVSPWTKRTSTTASSQAWSSLTPSGKVAAAISSVERPGVGITAGISSPAGPNGDRPSSKKGLEAFHINKVKFLLLRPFRLRKKEKTLSIWCPPACEVHHMTCLRRRKADDLLSVRGGGCGWR